MCVVIGLALGGMATGSLYAFLTTPQSQVLHLDELQQLQHSPGPYVPQ